MRIVPVVLMSAVLGACSILPSNPPVNTYRLPASHINVQVASSPLSLSIPEPYANRFIAHQRIAVVMDDYEVRAYQGARWEDAVHKVFRDRLLEDFQRANAYKTVLSNDEQINVDRSLRLDLQAYQLQYQQGKPFVRIEVNATLTNRRTGEVKGARHFVLEKSLSSAQLEEVLPAFAEINDQINAQIIQWTVGLH